MSAWDYTISSVSPTYIPWVYISEPCRANCPKVQVDRAPKCASTSQRTALTAQGPLPVHICPTVYRQSLCVEVARPVKYNNQCACLFVRQQNHTLVLHSKQYTVTYSRVYRSVGQESGFNHPNWILFIVYVMPSRNNQLGRTQQKVHQEIRFKCLK